MLITNQTAVDYWFGPMHLDAGVGQTLTLDDTTDTSLYLIDDDVADAVNTLYLSGMITVSSYNTPFPRPTGVPSLLHGDGSPQGKVYAPQGSLYMRRDNTGPSTALYVKTTVVTLNTGWYAISTVQAATYNGTVASPTGTSSSTQVMLGLAGSVTPAVTGSVLLIISGVWKNGSGASNGLTYSLYTGTGTAPANGAALTGTLRSAAPQATSPAANVNVPFSIQAIVTGLTLETAYWFDLAFSSTSGTNTISGVTVSAAEV